MPNMPLAVFPESGLSDSVITCVWVGVFVVAFFNLRLGWVLSGLVVPGYLVPLLLLKPWSVLAIFIEASVTYFLVWLYSERLSRLGLWSSLFGRDRFFALLLASVAVRLLFDGLVFPWLGAWLSARYQLQFDYINNLHSFGLIIVTLIANMFWKPGYLRGTATLVVIVALSFVIIRYGLMEWTNFSLGSVQYMYEDLANSILASPKAYIVLITTALIASRMNLYYGWEYNGILIPSLLALQWYQPVKVLTSFVEAFLILGLASALLRLPLLAHANIEGARKILLFFNVGFVYKWLLSLVLIRFFPSVKVTDAFAFGYLLSTLMAIKMHDKKVIGPLTRATLQTSLTAVAFATLVGYLLTWVPGLPELDFAGPSAPPSAAAEVVRDEGLIRALRREKVSIYRHYGRAGVPPPDLQELESFDAGLRQLQRYLLHGQARDLSAAVSMLSRAGYGLRLLEDRYLHLYELPPVRGRGSYVLDTRSDGNLLVEVPAPADERGTLDAGAWLYRMLEGRALAIAGTYRRTNPDHSTDVLRSRDSCFARFHRRFGRRNVLQVRGYTSESRRRLARVLGRVAVTGEPPTTLWVKRELPADLNLRLLDRMTTSLEVLWQEPGMINLLREQTPGGFAELFVRGDDLRRLLALSIGRQEQLATEERAERIDGYLKEWLLQEKGHIAPRGSNLYRPPSIEALSYLDEEVLTPLMRLLGAYRRGEVGAEALQQRLNPIAAAAAVLNYRLIRYHHRGSNREYLLLQEDFRHGVPRYWGTYVFRLRPERDLMIQVPRPLYELNSFEYAATLFERLGAGYLLIAGAHSRANRDGSADLVRLENIASVFNLVSQVVLRESWERPMLVVHSRAFGLRPGKLMPRADAMLAFSDGITGPRQLPAAGRELTRMLAEDGLRYVFVDGSPETAGYEVGSIPQSLYPATLPRKVFCLLWLSPYIREAFRRMDDDLLQEKAFRALALESEERDLGRYLPQALRERGVAALPDDMRAVLSHYLRFRDIVALRRLQLQWPGYDFRRLVDIDSRQTFLLVAAPSGRILAVVNLNPVSAGREFRATGEISRDLLRRFVDSRAAWLLFGKEH